MFSKLRTLAWYLRQPKGIVLVWLLLKRMTVYASRENTGVESKKWCNKLAVDEATALQKLFPAIQTPVTDIETSYPKEFQYAKERLSKTPYSMGGQGNMSYFTMFVNVFRQNTSLKPA